MGWTKGVSRNDDIRWPVILVEIKRIVGNHISVREMSRRLGISDRTLRKWMAGVCVARKSVIDSIAASVEKLSASYDSDSDPSAIQRNKNHIDATGTRSRYRAEYNAWIGMRDRCYNPNSSNFSAYGGRGIRICQEWLNDFLRFFSDMGPRPSSKHSIDRINNEGNYEPSNCRWATGIEQVSNRRPHKQTGGSRPGIKHHNCRLTEEDVIEIRQRDRNGESKKSLAATFGCNESSIWKIVKRQRWKHLQ